MLAIFKEGLVNPPKELNSPASKNSPHKPKHPDDVLNHFMSLYPTTAFSMSFGNDAVAACATADKPSVHRRLFCGSDEIYCLFLGGLNNLCSLNRHYGLTKVSNEALFIIEAYRTLRDRGPYPADQVLKQLEGSFGFVIYDNKSKAVFSALSADASVRLFWGIAADGSMIISENMELVKATCAKSFAPFPSGCMFHSEHGLTNFEHPTQKMQAMPRIDSEGVLCGANFKVNLQSRTSMMPRIGSEANWALRNKQA